ncbi:hypothetical protein TrLO_g8728 [Triparma laevis f. longispina]|uniref:Uncharacterized protein n=1 Tax=Triparma laevis f. longispina TaxID=1714387 RepID=A0A9W7E020_9STRA|nr:hypothetical protein TrLO_g8728 [Triparma laevis f. longispina]
MILVLCTVPSAVALRLPAMANRRAFIVTATSSLLIPTSPARTSAAETSTLSSDLFSLETSLSQLNKIPTLITNQKWDSVRAVLLEPPLKDLWAKNTPFTKAYASKVEDELSALEASDELLTHLRYLDMSVYNNVFNPIATEGESGASKELIRSYWEDPKRELSSCISEVKTLIELGQKP